LREVGDMSVASVPIDRGVMSDFHNRFVKLCAHPDKLIIDDLVTFSRVNIAQGYHIAQAIVSRFMDRNVPLPFKLPILYVVDAIMQFVAGVYPHYFSRYIIDVCRRASKEFPNSSREKDKLIFLLKKWSTAALMDQTAIQGLQQLHNELESTIFQQPQPPVIQHHLPTPPTMTMTMTMAEKEQIIRHDMQQQLDALLQGMNDTIALDDLPTRNPDVYNQLRQQAEMNFNSQHGQQQQQSLYAIPGMRYGGSGNLPQPPAYAVPPPRAPTHLPPPPKAPQRAAAVLQPAEYLSVWGKRHKQGLEDNQDSHLLCFLAETPTIVGLVPSQELVAKMDVTTITDESIPRGSGSGNGNSNSNSNSNSRAIKTAKLYLRKRMLDCLNEPRPELPSIITGIIPLAPSKQYNIGLESYKAAAKKAAATGVLTSSSAYGASRYKVPTPKFDNSLQALSQPKEYALRGLYHERMYQFQDDGIRFRSQDELDNYIDTNAISNQKLQNLRKNSILQSRQYYYTSDDWCEKFDTILSDYDQSIEAAILYGETNQEKNNNNNNNSSNVVIDDGWTYNCQADENFVRCPVSQTLFEQEFDEDEGELLYINAAKIYITLASDKYLYNLGKDTLNDNIRYLIVDKSLVLNAWLENGKAASINDCIERYSGMLNGMDVEVDGNDDGDNEVKESSVTAYTKSIQGLGAVSEDEDKDHTFAMLEL
jgi:hypothetical protein